MNVLSIMGGAKNLVFIGEAGSGKTEASLSLALALRRETSRPIHYFDMDQTKPLFRARTAAGQMEREGIVFHFQEQYMDAPTVVPAVIETLTNRDAFVLMDVGGGSHGSHMIGQFSRYLSGEDTRVLYLVNPYRAWSGGREDVEDTMARVLGTARLGDVSFVANPNLGPDTGAEDVLEGLARLRAMFPEREIAFVCALERLCPQVSAAVGESVLPLRLSTLPDWLLSELTDENQT